MGIRKNYGKPKLCNLIVCDGCDVQLYTIVLRGGTPPILFLQLGLSDCVDSKHSVALFQKHSASRGKYTSPELSKDNVALNHMEQQSSKINLCDTCGTYTMLFVLCITYDMLLFRCKLDTGKTASGHLAAVFKVVKGENIRSMLFQPYKLNTRQKIMRYTLSWKHRALQWHWQHTGAHGAQNVKLRRVAVVAGAPKEHQHGIYRPCVTIVHQLDVYLLPLRLKVGAREFILDRRLDNSC
jgi:hypothetical protein